MVVLTRLGRVVRVHRARHRLRQLRRDRHVPVDPLRPQTERRRVVQEARDACGAAADGEMTGTKQL